MNINLTTSILQRLAYLSTKRTIYMSLSVCHDCGDVRTVTVAVNFVMKRYEVIYIFFKYLPIYL